ncbi:EAL domain-containing protein [Aurantivibrio plasticivorans]
MCQKWVIQLVTFFLALNITIAETFADVHPSLDLSQQERMWLQEHPRITVAYDGNFPPYSFKNDSGDIEGIAIETFKLLEERLGIKFVEYHETQWQSLYNDAKQKRVDVVATMVNRTERAEWFKFTEPYIQKSLVIVTRGESADINRRSDLRGKRIALVKSYQYSAQIIKEFPTAEVVYVDTMLDGLRAVSTGKADAAITFLAAGHYLRTKYLLSNLKYAALYDRDSAAESIAVRSDWPEFQSILNKALSTISDYSHLQLREPWLPQNYQDLFVDISLTSQELQWIEAHPKIRVGVDPEFAPFEFMDNGRYAGMASEYLDLLNQRLNLDMQVVEGKGWDDIMVAAQRGDIDVLPAVGKTKAREQYLNYTEPYLQFYRVIITRDAEEFVFGLSDLRDKSVGVQVNSSHHGYLLEHSDIKPVTYETLESSLLALSGGEVDALVGNVASSTYWIRQLNLANIKVAAPVSSEIDYLHFATRKDWPELTSILQKGLDSINQRQRQEISERWLQIDYEPVIGDELLRNIVVVLFVITVMILLWNVLLKKKVKEQAEKVLRYAYYDPLTGLPNRFLVHERLGQFVRQSSLSNQKLATLSIDIDDFKKVNNTLGHEAGDEALKQIAECIAAVSPADSLLGRVGGDQFLLIIPALIDAADAALVAKSVLKNLENGVSVGHRNVVFTAGIGIALYPSDGETAEVLMQCAEAATHHVKQESDDQFIFYTPSLHDAVSRKLAVEEQLRNALKRNELYVVYQPKVDAATKATVGFEALIRWASKELGNVAPEEFIPIAEQNGQIESIGLFVLRSALAALKDINALAGRPLTMAVNLSPRQFISNRLIQQVKDEIERSGVDSHLLELEITEGVLMSGHQYIDDTLHAIKEMGVTLAMDDFGTGYSSLSYLRRYTFNTLKIDREFIADLEEKQASVQLVTATIAMAHGLGMVVVAEGVETAAQYELLRQLRCDLIQGWYFSEPFQAQELLDWMQETAVGVDVVKGTR